MLEGPDPHGQSGSTCKYIYIIHVFIYIYTCFLNYIDIDIQRIMLPTQHHARHPDLLDGDCKQTNGECEKLNHMLAASKQ